MIIEAMKKIRTDPSLLGDDELSSMRQLINGYRNELETEGQNYDKIRTELEDMALSAGLSAMEYPSLQVQKRDLSISRR